MDKPKWRQEFDALPHWAQKMVRALAGVASYGGMDDRDIKVGMSRNERNKYEGFHVLLRKEAINEWFDGFVEMRELAAAMTAPWPPALPDAWERSSPNLVEMIADEEDCAFDQPCAFGHRVNGHAVYCHNSAWPDSPRKCCRNRDDYRHEDCPGFVANPDAHGAEARKNVHADPISDKP